MSLQLLQEIQEVTPTQAINEVKEDYATSAGLGVCLALLQYYGEDDFRRWFPGGLQQCVQWAQNFYAKQFSKWEMKWGPKMAWTIRTLGGGAS